MPIVALATEPKCKICRSERRGEVDELLLLRSRRARDTDGQRVTLTYVRECMREWGIVNPTQENITVHLRKHCAIIDAPGEDFELERHYLSGEAKELAARFDEQGPANADTLPDRVIAVYDLQMRADLRAGVVPRVTADQARAMIDTKTRRRQNERITDLLDIHTAALTGAVGWDHIDAGPHDVREIEA
jgi:hypothetical protein